MNNEEWRVIPGYEPYQASNLGRIKGIKGKGRPLTPVLTQYGYYQQSLCIDKKKLTRFVHRLVAYAFIGPQPSAMHDVLHNNGIKTDNIVTNLRWGLPVENSNDQIIHDTQVRGERHGRTILTNIDIITMRKLFDSGMSVVRISNQVNLQYRNVWDIVHRRTWKHIN